MGSTLFSLAGFTLVGEKTFLSNGLQRIPITPITHEKMLLHGLSSKMQASRALKAGGNVLGGVGYAVSATDYGVHMADGNYRGARKSGVDMYMGALMFFWPYGTAVGAVGLYVNNDYHSDPSNP
ncbi:hypothetical protein ACCI49_24260 [Microbulbifer epialgicus]|uniref:Uncharacterized protein n=1 Tax=Microbulbifer epialgicus TaxID=393907 RepID=A0ABV4P8I8_9GAMM